ncbi:hypothetical protein [Proteiniphilum sp. X52]|uniref:hypothetical protein n=1 Tax=Proteiniphilum sp. X52 TaxID=2382159 RepID=UPI0011CD4CB6|nr:hypothetical protein [Proteiniphilum sp. X52]
MKQLIFTAVTGCLATGLQAQQPHIIYIMTDQQTASALGCVKAGTTASFSHLSGNRLFGRRLTIVRHANRQE